MKIEFGSFGVGVDVEFFCEEYLVVVECVDCVGVIVDGYQCENYVVVGGFVEWVCVEQCCVCILNLILLIEIDCGVGDEGEGLMLQGVVVFMQFVDLEF